MDGGVALRPALVHADTAGMPVASPTAMVRVLRGEQIATWLGWSAVIAAFGAWLAVPHAMAGVLLAVAFFAGLGSLGVLVPTWRLARQHRQPVHRQVILATAAGLLAVFAEAGALAAVILAGGPG